MNKFLYNIYIVTRARVYVKKKCVQYLDNSLKNRYNIVVSLNGEKEKSMETLNDRIKIDAHVHSSGVSKCSVTTCQQIVDIKKAQGYDGVILTNHCQSWYYEPPFHAAFMRKAVEEYHAMRAYASTLDFRVLLGLEVTLLKPVLSDWLLYGATEAFLLQSPCLHALTQKELFRYCEENGVVMVQAHPFRHGGAIKERMLNTSVEHMHGIEINCTPCDLENWEAVTETAEKYNLLVTCGTDFHAADRTFRGGMFVPNWVNTAEDFGKHLKETPKTEIFLEEKYLALPNQKK